MSKHMKLSDVEASKVYPFRQPSTFEKAFPTVENIEVEVRPDGEGFEPFPGQQERVDIYRNAGIPPIINCRNPRCYGGGLDLQSLIRWGVVERRREEFEDTIRCEGYEGSPKGRKKYDTCDTRFRVKIKAKYKMEAARDTSSAGQ